MTEQVPVIQTAEKDGEGPAKKRRRPALSCVECRSRKVRCDRKKPCGSCTRSKSITCTFRPSRPGFRDSSPGARSPSVGTSNGPEPEMSARASPCPVATSNEFDAMVNRYVAPGIFGEHDKQRLRHLPAGRPSLSLSSQPKTGDSALVNHLLERIASLEGEKAIREGREVGSDQPLRSGPESATGQFVKSRFYGQSHWMNALEPYEALGEKNVSSNSNTNRVEVNKSTELYRTVTKIKQMARIIKTSRLSQPSLPQDVLDSIPSKAVCDLLLDGYLRTFEAVFRVLHIPTFRKEYEAYWAGEVHEKPSLVLKILLVCSIGVPFYSGADLPLLRNACVKWIQAAAQWLNGPHTKSRLNMAGLQIQMLHLLAQQVCNVDGDHTWIPAGSLLRSAMHLGLHRDPALVGKMSVYHCEMRRRLWATVLEITAQSSLDMGMPPMISANDYDTKPPSNINDEDIGEEREVPLDEKPPTQYTDSSVQIAFTQTLPTRLEIIRLINNLRFDLSYDDVLRIGDKLTNACRDQTIFLKSALNEGHTITPFQIKLADSLVRRFVLCLHRPYFAKAKENPQYHYSRKMCLDTSLAIYAPATESIPGQDDDWTKMTHRCVGFFKSLFLYAMSTVYMELNAQIDEQKHASAVFAPLITTTTASSNPSFTLPAQYHALRAVLESAHETAVARLRNGEPNAKGCAFLSCALARIDALVAGEDPELAVLNAAKRSIRDSANILSEVFRAEHGVPVDLSILIGGKSPNRADEVAEQNLQSGADAGVFVDPAMTDVYGSGSFDGGIPAGGVDGFDMLGGGLGGFSGGIDIDLDAYMSGQTLGAGNGDFHFGRSPEWFYDLNGWAAAGTVNWNMGTGYGV